MQAVNCAQCGAKVRAGARRCPRCRAVFSAPDPVAAAAASRRMLQVAAGTAAVFVLVVGILWLRSAPELPVGKAAAVTAPRDLPQAAAAAPVEVVARPAPAATPFLDPAAAGAAAYGAGDLDGALAQYLAALEKNPHDAESLSNLGQVLVKQGKAEEALPYFERAVEKLPNRWTYRFNLARAQGLLGHWDQAVEGYRSAQSIFPDDYATAFNLGMALHKLGNEAEAVKAYERAISLEPTEPSFRMALAISYERLQKPAEAAAAYGEALRLQPDAPDADRVRARIAQLTSPPGGPAAPGGQ